MQRWIRDCLCLQGAHSLVEEADTSLAGYQIMWRGRDTYVGVERTVPSWLGAREGLWLWQLSRIPFGLSTLCPILSSQLNHSHHVWERPNQAPWWIQNSVRCFSQVAHSSAEPDWTFSPQDQGYCKVCALRHSCCPLGGFMASVYFHGKENIHDLQIIWTKSYFQHRKDSITFIVCIILSARDHDHDSLVSLTIAVGWWACRDYKREEGGS